ncbi:hypothetical protein [Actinoplanes sp. NPDC049681]|uniref:hypothetical protein n=1 Tax=Actinoplanes sp. NPDC049681 TaxID=3363905 RepID=UPI00379F5D49
MCRAIDLEDPMRPHRSTVLLGVLAAGLVLTQQACISTGRDMRRPVAFTAPPAGNPVLSGRRQIVIRPIPPGESSVTGVLNPVGDKYMIKVVEGSCLGVGKNGAVAGEACDPSRAGQLFTITPAGASAYAISNQGEFLQISPGGDLIAKGPLMTTYTFTDNGPVR